MQDNFTIIVAWKNASQVADLATTDLQMETGKHVEKDKAYKM